MNSGLRTLGILVLIGLCTATIGAEDFRDAATVSKRRGIHIEFVSYAAFGGAAGFTTEWDGFPVIDVSSGIQFTPWLGIGGFASASPLSDFEDASFGITVADRENSYALCTGTELLFTPWARNIVHPLFRISLGGASVGYLEDQDGKKGMDTAIDERFFYTTCSAGGEVNVSRRTRIYAQVGGRFVANEGVLGIADSGLSGLEIRIGLRLLWRTVID
jgi:hypothetical protein